MKKLFLVIFSMFFCMTAISAFAADNLPSFKVGDYKLIAIQDTIMMQDIALLHASKDIIGKYVKGDKCESSATVYLLDMGKKGLVIFDTGMTGAAVKTMRKSGYSPDNVSAIFMTHLHGDHTSGAISPTIKEQTEKARIFKNAKIYVPKEEAAFWSDEGLKAKSPEAMAPFIDMAVNFLKTYSDRIVLYDQGAKLIDNITPMAAFGHTPGHTMYKVTSGKDELLIWGDIMHCLAVQINEPAVTIDYDINPQMAAKSRMITLEMLVDSKALIAGYHLPFPGVGKITKENGKYKFNKVEK